MAAHSFVNVIARSIPSIQMERAAMSFRFKIAFGVVSFWMLACSQPVHASVIVGRQYTVNNINFRNTFTENVSLDGASSTINSGQLNVSETIVPDGLYSVWVVFDFETTSGGPLATNLSGSWRGRVENIQFLTPVGLDAFFVYWDVDGVPFSNILPLFGNTIVTTNPLTGSGEVYYGEAAGPVPLSLTHALFATLNPYNQLNSRNINSATANGWHIAGHFTSPIPINGVPEPGSLLLGGLGAIGVFAGARRRQRSGVQSSSASPIREQ
jgi:hypothetical protein